MIQYQVVGHVAHVRTQTPQGPMTRLLYRGSLLPDDVPAEQVRHLLDVKLIAPFGADGSNLPGASAPPPVGGQVDSGNERTSGSDENHSEVKASGESDDRKPTETPYDDPERVAAREKLPTDGSLPDGRAAHAVWVEAAVREGYDYTAAKGTGKPELIELVRNTRDQQQ